MSPLVQNLRPVAVDSPQDGHISDQDLTDFGLLNVLSSEFLPSPLATEFDEKNLEKVLDSASHVINEILRR